MPVLNIFQRTLIAFAVSQIIPISSLAATIEVTSISGTSVANDCTLRDAIMAAETDAIVAACPAGNGSDTIDLTGLPGNSTIILLSRLPTISSSISINGSGRDMLSISGSGQAGIIDTGILNVTEGGELNLSSLTLTQAAGTAITTTLATLTLDSVDITNNSAFFAGGAIGSNNSSINIINSTISNNSASDYGGGIYSTDSEIVINNSVLSHNSVLGPSRIFDSEFSGGGIRLSNGSLLIRDSLLSGNSALGSGGALSSFASSITIENSTLSQNNARIGGAIESDAGTININKSTLSRNNATANGGGVFGFRAFFNINNSTLSSNSASINGGGISTSFSTITIDHSTIVKNIADNVGSGMETRDLSVIVSNSIISGNSTSAREGAEVFSGGGFTAINNILGFDQLTNSSAFFGFLPDSTNIVATSDEQNISLAQIINPLADNGGNSFTHSLPENSPAFNASNNIDCPEEDQRGELRNDGQCDIGAFEGGSNSVLKEENFFIIPNKNGKTIIFSL